MSLAIPVFGTLAVLGLMFVLPVILVLSAGRERTLQFVGRLKSLAPRLGVFGPKTDQLCRDTRAQLALGGPMVIIGVVVAAILAFIVIGALVSPFLSATSSVTENFSAGDTGNADANTLLTALGPVIPIIAVVALFGMILAAFSLRD